MNETLNTIKNRRSTRKFNNKEISEDILNQILEAGTYAPTGMNKQSPIIICIKDKKIRNEIIKENACIGGFKEGFDPFYGAPIIILVIAKNIPTAVYDGSCVIENIMLAATSLGVSSCWIHRAKEEIESPFGKNLLKKLNIEGDYIGVGHVALGYGDEKTIVGKSLKDNWIYKI